MRNGRVASNDSKNYETAVPQQLKEYIWPAKFHPGRLDTDEEEAMLIEERFRKH